MDRRFSRRSASMPSHHASAKKDGCTKGIMTLVYAEWRKDHAHDKTTRAALKAKLTTMKQEGLVTNNIKSTEAKDPAQDNNMNVLNQSVAAIKISDGIEMQQSTPVVNPTMETEPANQRNNCAPEQHLPPIPVTINNNDVTTAISSNKPKRSTKKKQNAKCGIRE